MNVPYLMKQDLFDLDFGLSKEVMSEITETDRFPIFRQMAGEDDGVWISIRTKSGVMKREVCGLFLMDLPEMEIQMVDGDASEWGEA